ncbi:MAG: tetratricopeptide repeat protein, partial [Chloroflexota bacterium]
MIAINKLPLLAIFLISLLASCNLPISDQPPSDSATQPAPQAGTTPLPTLAATLPPTPTLQPATRIESGDQALFYGDWDRALREYQTAFDHADQDDLRYAALLGLGRTYFQLGEYAAALDAFRAVVDFTPNEIQRGHAQFALGQTFDELQRYPEAAASYAQYFVLRPTVIDYYALERQADSLTAARDYQTAIGIYQQALAAPHLGDALHINIKIGDAYALLGDPSTAIVVYNDVFNRTSNDYTKSQMALYIGQAHTAMGQIQQAHTAWNDTVTNYPISYYSYLALVELVSAGVPVDELNRGIIDYYAGQYAVAAEAFDRYIAAIPTQHPDSIHFYRGLTQVELGNYDAAIAEFDEQILTHQGERLWVDAWDEKSYTQWVYLEDYVGAVQTLQNFVFSAPANARAAELLFYAGRIAERSGDLETAAQIWARVGVEYPTSEYASDAFFLAGISRFRIEKYAEAVEDFRSSLAVSNTPSDQARSHFWAAKTLQILGENSEATLSLQVAIATDPTGYYSERARDTLEGRTPFQAGISDLNYDLESERLEAEAWVRNAFGMAAEVDLSGPGPLASDDRFWRGTELWQLGLYNEARTEFESLRVDVAFDPANTFRLANYFIDIDLYRPGITAARQVLNLAGMDDAGTLNAPAFFNHIRFGIYFTGLILPVAETYNFDPLFLSSVVRQESLFEGFVISSAGARGLMQIIPNTGQSIATQLEWPPNYVSEDLYRPLVSISLGTDYLSGQRNYFDGDLYAALAAYNAGPGNSA